MLLDVLISVACGCLESFLEVVKVTFDERILKYKAADLIDRPSNRKNATRLCQTSTVSISVHSLRSLSVADERRLHTPWLIFDLVVEHVVQFLGFEPLHC